MFISADLADPGSAGTYFYVVTAEDAMGNLSGPSNQASATVTADTTAPSVAVTAAASATLSGSIIVSTTASDNVSVAGVQSSSMALRLAPRIRLHPTR